METDRRRATELDALIGAELSARVGPGDEGCPEADILAAYAEGGLAAAERLSIELHLESCSRCQAILALVATDVTETGEMAAPTPEDAGAGILPRRRWRLRLQWLLPVGAAACAAVLYVAVGPIRDADGPPATLPGMVADSSAPRPAEKVVAAPPLARHVEPAVPAPEAPPPARADQSVSSQAQSSSEHAAPSAGRPVSTFAAEAPTLDEAAIAAPHPVVLSARAAAPSAKGTLMTLDAQADDVFTRADVVVLATAGSSADGRVPFDIVEVFKHADRLIPVSRLSVDEAVANVGQDVRYVLFLRVAGSGDGSWFESVGHTGVLVIAPATPSLVARLRQLAGTTRR